MFINHGGKLRALFLITSIADDSSAQEIAAEFGLTRNDLKEYALRMIALIDSMTPQERSSPNIVDAGRSHRISRGCGLAIPDVILAIRVLSDINIGLGRIGE